VTPDSDLDNLRSVLGACRLCPRCCGANRLAGQAGRCGAGATARIYRYGPHFGEEPPLSGSRGSGTVFFSHCTLNCLYCQNYPWSQEGRGTDYDARRLADVFRELREAGCHNYNLVSPTPWVPQVVEALESVNRDGPRVPVVYNTSGFERVELLRRLEGVVDVYLPDLRYATAESAEQGSGYAGYVDIARAALLEMWRQAGPLRTDAAGVAVGGTICRLLVLPNRAEETIASLEWLASAVGAGIAVSVMSQYIPAYRAGATPTWDRAVTRAEYSRVRGAVERLGFEGGWVQAYGMPASKELIGYRMKESS
jgi:putative pyruvate formate lyase activating enzyme